MSNNNSYEEMFGSPMVKGSANERRSANPTFKEFKERNELQLGDRLLENSIDKPIAISKNQSPSKSDASVEVQHNITVQFTKNVLNYLLGKKDWLKFSAPGVQVRDFKKLLTTMFEATFGAKFCVVIGNTEDGLSKIECFASTTPSKKSKASEVEEDPPVKICVATTRDWKQDCDAIYFILIKKVSSDMLESISKQLDPEILKKITAQVEKAKVQEDFHHFTGKNQDLGKLFNKPGSAANQPQSKQSKQAKETVQTLVEPNNSKPELLNSEAAAGKKKGKKKKKKQGNSSGVDAKESNPEAPEILIDSGNNESAQGSKPESNLDGNTEHLEIIEEKPAENVKVSCLSHEKSEAKPVSPIDEEIAVDAKLDSSQNSKVEEEILSLPDKASPNLSRGAQNPQENQKSLEVVRESPRLQASRHEPSPSKQPSSFKHPSTSTGQPGPSKSLRSNAENSPKGSPAPNSAHSSAAKQTVGSKKKRKQEKAAREAAMQAENLEDDDFERVEAQKPAAPEKDREKFLQKRALEKSLSRDSVDNRGDQPRPKLSHERPIIKPAVLGRADPLSPRKVHFQDKVEKTSKSSRIVDEIVSNQAEVLSDGETPKSTPQDTPKPKSIRTDKTDSHIGTLVESDNSFKGSQAFRDKAGKASVPARDAPYKPDFHRKGNQDRDHSWKSGNRDTQHISNTGFGSNRGYEPSNRFTRRESKPAENFRDEKVQERSRKSSTEFGQEVRPTTPQTDKSGSVTNQVNDGPGGYQKIKYKRRNHNDSSSSEKNKSSEYSRTSNPYTAVNKQEHPREKDAKPDNNRPRFNDKDQQDRSPKNYNNFESRGRNNYNQDEKRPYNNYHRGGDQHRGGQGRGSTHTNRSHSLRPSDSWKGPNQRYQGDTSDRGNQERSNGYPPSSSTNWRGDQWQHRQDNRSRPPYDTRRDFSRNRPYEDRRQGNYQGHNEGQYSRGGNRGFNRGGDSRDFKPRNEQQDRFKFQKGNESDYFALLDSVVAPKTKRSSDKKDNSDRR